MTLYEHERKVNDTREKLRQILRHTLIALVVLYSRTTVQNIHLEVTSTHQKKLDNLYKQQERPLFIVHDTVRFFELDIHPPKYVLDTLSMGPKNPILYKFKQKELLAEINLLLNRLGKASVSNDVLNDINVANLKYVKSCSSHRTPRHIIMPKRYFREKDLLPVPFDKGFDMCVMKRQTYIFKLNDILNLEQFEKVTFTRKNGRDLCLKEEDRINSALQNLHEQGKIDNQTLKKLKSMGGQLPRLYGLAKVHKKDTPLRPVLSMPGLPYNKIAQKVTEWLSVVPESKINSPTQKTVGSLKRTTLESDEVIISFDVTSLYTNVPIKEAIQEAADRLYSGEVQTPSLDKETFITLATISCTNVILSTHDGTYWQMDGLPMGSPPAPPLSNIRLSKYDPTIKDDAKLFECYMDDILRTINENLIENKLSESNSLHPNLKFTLEVEKNGELPFLDICIEHHQSMLSSTWYCKSTDIGLILNFHAMAPKRYKRSVI